MSNEGIETLRNRKERIRQSARDLRAEAAELDEQSRRLEERIRAAGLEPRISDYALLAWLEKVEGMDLQSLRNRILTPERKDQIAAIGSGSIKLRCGTELVISRRCVVNVK